MQVVILAWGLWTRLRPITETIPKPMVEVDGRPYLEHQINMIKNYGFTQFLLLVGYLWNQIEEYFGNGEKFWISIEYNYEKELLGTGGALKLAEEKLEEKFLLIYGDSYLDYDYHKLIKFGEEWWYTLTLTAYDNQEDTNVLNNLEVRNGKVLQYKKWIKDSSLNLVEAGVLYVRKSILNELPKNTIISLEEGVFPALIEKGALWAYSVTTRFYDIGTFERLEVFKDFSV